MQLTGLYVEMCCCFTNLPKAIGIVVAVHLFRFCTQGAYAVY